MNIYIYIYIYIYTRLCNMGCISMLAAFCPAPPTHVGQPPAFDESDDDSQGEWDEKPAESEWMWELGVVQRRQNEPNFRLR